MDGSVAVLGVNAAHDASACLLVDGTLVAAVSEERLSRRKHHEGMPARAIAYCLGAAGLPDLDALDCIVVNQYPAIDHADRLRVAGYGGELLVNPSHHLLHAYYAWVASGFDDTAVMVIDGSGYHYGEFARQNSPYLGESPPYSEMEEAESLYTVDGGKLELLSKRWALWESRYPLYRFASLGHMYAAASQYIFGHWQHAGKTMGLAPYGDPSRFGRDLVDLTGPDMIITTDWVAALPPRSDRPAHLDPVCRDLAATVQAELERAVLHLAHRLHERTGHTRLCISGGVGLNSVTNGRIVRETPFEDLFVTPAAGDAGVAIGAALYAHQRRTGALPRWRQRTDYHGRRYSPTEVSAALAARTTAVQADSVADPAGQAAADLADGLIVGWFEGGSEFGPRALGHRSILCDPRGADMRTRLNDTVKFREPFRPYAASVLTEHVDRWFDMPVEDPFMLVVAPVREHYRDRVAGVCHVDNTCRLQTVPADHPGMFRRLIEAFHERTGVPLVLNTSFNVRGEPVVESPDDALDCFLASNLDVLYLEGHRLIKVTAEDRGSLIPALVRGLSFGTVFDSRGGHALAPRHHLRTRTGHRTQVRQEELDLLQAVDGVRTVAEIRADLGIDAETGYADLNRRGFIYFRA
jgi:carbamoyltransferase